MKHNKGNNNFDNPHPNYWKNLPSSYFDVWYNDMESFITNQAFTDWQNSYNYWKASTDAPARINCGMPCFVP